MRVAGLKDQVAAGVRTRSADGLRPGEQLDHDQGPGRGTRRRHTSSSWTSSSRAWLNGIHFTDWSSLDADDRQTSCVEVFEREIYPVLTPLSVDPGHPFPYISNLSLNLVVEVEDPPTGEGRFARVKVPPLLPRFVMLSDGERFVPLEQVIAANLDTLFPDMASAPSTPSG